MAPPVILMCGTADAVWIAVSRAGASSSASVGCYYSECSRTYHSPLSGASSARGPVFRSVLNRLWCAIQVVGAERSLEALSDDALRHRHPEPGHPVEHRAADPGFGLLGRQSPGAKARADDSFVAKHGGLPERAPAGADRRLPAQAP